MKKNSKLTIAGVAALAAVILFILRVSHPRVSVYTASLDRAKLVDKIRISSASIRSLKKNKTDFGQGDYDKGSEHPIYLPFIDPDLGPKARMDLVIDSATSDSVVTKFTETTTNEEKDEGETEYLFAIYVYDDPIELPKFPEPTLESQQNLRLNYFIKDSIIFDRAKYYFEHANHGVYEDVEKVGGIVLDQSWLLNAFLVKVPVNQWDPSKYPTKAHSYSNDRSGNPNLLSIVRAGVSPSPGMKSKDALHDIKELAKRMKLDSYKEFSLGNAWSIGVIDSGLWSDHIAFQCDSSPIKSARFCEHWSSNCQPLDHQDLTGHGTAVASIINSCPASNSSGEKLSGGTTDISINSYGFPRSSGNHSRWLVIQALENAVLQSDKIVNISQSFEANGKCTPERACTDVLSMAVNATHITGAAIFIAAGNIMVKEASSLETKHKENGQPIVTLPEYLRSPGRAKLALTVGIDNSHCQRQSKHHYGLTTDERFKPELKAYTCATAAWGVDNQSTTRLGYSSGATPFVTSAAALLRSWLIKEAGQTPDPGLIYAMLILSGQNTKQMLRDTGTETLQLPQTGTLKWGEANLVDMTELVIPITGVSRESYERLDVAVWWPEQLSFPESSMNNASTIYIDISKSNETIVSSEIKRSVYQRVGLKIDSKHFDNKPSKLEIRIKGLDIAHGSQKLYWAAFLKKRE